MVSIHAYFAGLHCVQNEKQVEVVGQEAINHELSTNKPLTSLYD